MPTHKPVPNDPKVTEAFADLAAVIDADVPKVQEQVFRLTILPILLSKEKVVSFEPWLRVADSILRPLDICIGDRVIFRCPPIGRPVNLRQGDNPHDSIFENVAMSMQKDDVVPNLGQNYINHVLRSRIAGGALSPKEIANWRTVFDYYKVNHTTDEQPNALVKPTVQINESNFLADDYDLA